MIYIHIILIDNIMSVKLSCYLLFLKWYNKLLDVNTQLRVILNDKYIFIFKS